jgi:beta-lactamase class A
MNQNELLSYLDRQMRETQAKVSLLVRNLKTGKTIAEREPDRKVASASTIKTPILLTALEQVRRGRLALDQMIAVSQDELLEDSRVFEYGPCETTLREILFWMIVNSDNTAANVIIRLLSMKTINSYCKDTLHLSQTFLFREMLDFQAQKEGRENTTSAEDQFQVFTKLERQSILTPKLCSFALEILQSNRNFSMALRYIGEPCKTAHKTGELDHLGHDTGILYFPNGRSYFFGYFVTDDVDGESRRLIGRMNRAVFEFLNDWAE